MSDFGAVVLIAVLIAASVTALDVVDGRPGGRRLCALRWGVKLRDRARSPRHALLIIAAVLAVVLAGLLLPVLLRLLLLGLILVIAAQDLRLLFDRLMRP